MPGPKGSGEHGHGKKRRYGVRGEKVRGLDMKRRKRDQGRRNQTGP